MADWAAVVQAMSETVAHMSSYVEALAAPTAAEQTELEAVRRAAFRELRQVSGWLAYVCGI